MEQKHFNLKSNAKKTVICKYSRQLRARNEFKKERNINLNGSEIVWNQKMNILTFLGFHLDFNKLDFFSKHREKKVENFMRIRRNIYFKGIIGGKMPIDIQIKYYKDCIRTAFTYGLRCVDTPKSKLNDIDTMQRSYLSTILGVDRHTNSTAIRMILGIPKLSDRIIKLKLSMYYDIHKQTENVFKLNIVESHKRLRAKYKEYNGVIGDISPKWQYSTIDWIRYIEEWHLPIDYTEPRWLPITREKWLKILDKKMREKYNSEIETFLETNGKLISTIFGNDYLIDKHRRKGYQGFLEELKQIYGQNSRLPSTDKLSRSVKMLLNCMRLNWWTVNHRMERVNGEESSRISESLLLLNGDLVQ